MDAIQLVSSFLHTTRKTRGTVATIPKEGVCAIELGFFLVWLGLGSGSCAGSVSPLGSLGFRVGLAF